jgi:hypothetical protein
VNIRKEPCEKNSWVLVMPDYARPIRLRVIKLGEQWQRQEA